ncbi:MAG: OmpA family protein [Erysipelotrichales bacterium]|nr:OmpA family protein [Erysipelotrichales bacterium]
MKKFFTLVVAMIMAVGATFAQTTHDCEQSNYAGHARFFDNWTIGLEGGVQTNLYDWNTPEGAVIGLNLNKYIVPQFRVSLQGYMGFNNTGMWNTPAGHVHNGTGVDNVQVYLTGGWNLMNTFSKYTGKPKVFEIETEIGVGYGHFFYNPSTWNYGVVLGKTGLDFRFNLGKARAWAIDIRPTFIWDFTNALAYEQIASNRTAVFQVTAGVEYRFNTSNGTHNMKPADLYDCVEVNALNMRINELLACNDELKKALEECLNRPKEVEVVEETTVVTNTNVVTKPVFATIGFERNSSKILGVYDLNVRTIADFMKASDQHFTVVGFASEEGNVDYNEALSLRRAQAVADALEAYGVDPAKIHVEGKGATTEFGNALDLNRTVQIVAE